MTMGRVLESVAGRLECAGSLTIKMLGLLTAAVILNPTDMAIASILDRNIALNSNQHASASVIQEKVVCSSTLWRALAKLSKWLGPIG